MNKRKIAIRIVQLIIIACTLYFVQVYISDFVYNLRDNINNTHELNIQFQRLPVQFVGVFSIGAILVAVILAIESIAEKLKQ